MRIFITFIAVLVAGAVLAQAYQWVDEDGVVHYSDRPVAGATRIYLPEDTRRSRPYPVPRRTDASAGAEETGSQKPFSYDSIEVSAPSPEETLWNIEGVLNVSLSVQPPLRPEHRVRVYFDGVPKMVTGSNFQIQGVYRGVHNIQAEVLDETGQTMGRSVPNRFYVQQTTVNR